MPREVRSRDRLAPEHSRSHYLKPRCRVCGGPYPCLKKEGAEAREQPYEPPVPKCWVCGDLLPCDKQAGEKIRGMVTQKPDLPSK